MIQRACWSIVALAAMGLACGPPAERSLCSGQEPLGSSIKIAAEDELGEPMVISGQVWIGMGRTPLSGVRLIVYHQNAEGYYAKDGSGYPGAYLCGVLQTDAEGRYLITTIRPGSDPRRRTAAHVHFELTVPWGDRIHDAVTLEGDPFLGDLRAGESWEEIRPAIVDEQGVHHVEKDFWIRF